MKKIVYLPLDERPCNYEFAKRIADCANGYELVRPDKELLGKKKIPASYENIDKFLFNNVKDSVACVLSLEMLLYGGISGKCCTIMVCSLQDCIITPLRKY